AQDDHSEVDLVPDEATDTLLQRDDRWRDLLLEERFSPAPLDRTEARLQDRSARHRERQLLEHDDRQRRSLHGYALPERARSPQSPIARFPELREQSVSRRIALHEHGIRKLRAELPKHNLGAFAQRAMAREEQERAPAARFQNRQRRIDDTFRISRRVRRIELRRQIEQGLPRIVEWAAETRRCRIMHTDTA